MARIGMARISTAGVAAVLIGASAPVVAQDVASVAAESAEEPQATTPLMPQDILTTSARRFPDILASLERQAAARGDQLAAEGAFDLVFKAGGKSYATGFYSGSVAETEGRRRLRGMGAEVFGSYRISDGRFPVYDDEYFTNALGELKIGALFSLLRDRTIDKQRFGITDARLAARQAALDVLLTQLGVQQRALKAYWVWVATGREVEIYRDLLTLAETRRTGLERQVRLGAQPEIALVENQQNIIKRQRLVAEAKRDFSAAANALSFYYRDDTGGLIIPTADQLPPVEMLGELPTLTEVLQVRSSDILNNRPELKQFRIAIDRARNMVALKENDLKPKLDLSVEVSRDFGAIGDGGASRDSTDAIVGFTFTVPLERRTAQGNLQKAEAGLREIQIKQQATSEQILIEVENILIDLEAALEIATLATQEVEQAQTMVAAEKRRFSLGASDFFLINLREEAAADAQVRALRAELGGRLASASYDAATMNLEQLGLSEPPL